MQEQLIKRFKSFLWQAAALAFVTAGAYILNVGSIFSVEPKTLIDMMVLAVTGLAVSQVTKFLNTKTEDLI